MESFEVTEDVAEVEDIVEVAESSSAAPPQVEEDLQAVGSQSVCNKLKWFLIRKTFKVLILCTKALVVVSISALCFEAFMQGSEGNWEKVSTAGKEDVLALANFAMLKVKQLAVAVMEKYKEMESSVE